MRARLLPATLIFGIVLALFGCGTPPSEMLYGSLPPEQLAQITKQLDSMCIHYEVKNGNQVYIPNSDFEKMEAAYGLGWRASKLPVKIEVGQPPIQ